MPMLEALYERIPKLAAREQLRAVDATALGTGSMKPDDHKRQWRALLDRAGFPPARRPATPANLRALGIKVQK